MNDAGAGEPTRRRARRQVSCAIAATTLACVAASSHAAAAKPGPPTPRPKPGGPATHFAPCSKGSLVRCGTVTVPLDRTGSVAGTIRLHVRRLGPPGRREAVFALAGGPGQAGASFIEYVAVLLREGLRGRELVTFDQRGTGRSGLLRCPTLEGAGRAFNIAGAAADCADTLGPRRSSYTTQDSVEDLEAVRQAVGADRVILYGTSYGTRLALAYASAYPAHVDRLVLESTVPAAGPDPFALESYQAMPRVLHTLCAVGCARITTDAAADLAALMARLAPGPLRGPLVRDDGQAHVSRLGRIRLLDLLFAGDFDPTLRSGLPAAMRSALNGDPAPILRLAWRADRISQEPVSYFSEAVYAATTCEDGPLPWSRATPVGSRQAEAQTRVNALPSSALGPVDRLTAFVASPIVQLCRLWPTSPVDRSAPARPLPAVPTLLLTGEDDLRTPLESAARVAALLPQATLVAVPDAGHAVLGWPTAGCARRALRSFLTGGSIEPCVRHRRLVPPEPIAPTSITQLRPSGGPRGRPGRTVTAVRRTLEDMGVQLLSAFSALDIFREGIGGLRGGRLAFKRYGIGLQHVQYVPGVSVNGQLRGAQLSRGFIRVGGRAATHGRLRLRRGVLSGRLGGRRVRFVLPADVLGGQEQLDTQGPPAAAVLRSGLRRLPLRSP